MISRIMIIGGPGSGKTWIAEKLGRQLQLPVYSVDDAVWNADGQLRKAHEIDLIVRELACQESWIIEGGNSRTYRDRVAQAQLIIRMITPLWLRLLRVMLRDGFRIELLRSTIQYDAIFGDKDRAALAAANKSASTIEIRSQREAISFLERCRNQG